MRKVALAASVAMLIAGLGGVGFAAQSTVPQASATSGVAPKALSATGKIVSFDDSTHMLTLSTSKGEEKFLLGSSARLQEGAKTITADTLSSLAGHSAKVRYTASGNSKAAESVMVSGGGRAKSSK